MKTMKNLVLAGQFFGIVLIALASSAAARASVVVFDNTGGYSDGSTEGSAGTFGQTFIMAGYDGAIDGLTLTFASRSSGSAAVDLYTISGSTWTLDSALGTVDGSGVVTLSSNPTLLANADYAIVLNVPTDGSLYWLVAGKGNDPTVGTSPYGSIYHGTNGGSSWSTLYSGQSLQMQVSVVPEIPMTGMVMGFGVLGIAIGHTLRRRALSAVAS